MSAESLRFLIVTIYYKPAYVYGGPVRSLSALAEGLVQQGVSVSVFATDANGATRLDVPLREPVMVDGVTVTYYPLPARSFGTFYYAPELAQACQEHVAAYDVVLLEVLWGYISGPTVAACKRHRIPYIVAPRGQLLPWSFGKKNLKKRLYMALFARRHINGAAAIHCTDPVEAEAIKRFNFHAPTIIVPNSVDVTRFVSLPPRQQMRNRLGIAAEARVLLFLGRLHPKKRPDIAVAVLVAVQDLPGDIHLILAGPDEMGMADDLRDQARQAGCEDRLHIVGLLEGNDVLQALAASDLLLMPSEPQSENFGMSAVEAMAAGVPVLVSEGVPVGIWAEQARAGHMLPCSSSAFVDATRALIANTEKLQAMATCGRELVSRRFDNISVARQMLAQSQAIVETGQPRVASDDAW